MDLAGHDQYVKNIAWDNTGLDPVKFNGYITNSAGKTFLHVIDTTASQKSLLPFRGSAGLSFDGTGKTTLYSVSSSTGDVQVTSGELAFASGAFWLKSDEVSVVGTGKLTLADVTQLGVPAKFTLDVQREAGAAGERLVCRGRLLCGRQAVVQWDPQCRHPEQPPRRQWREHSRDGGQARRPGSRLKMRRPMVQR